MLKIVGAQEGVTIHAGELAALIGVDQHLRLGFASPDRHEQGLQDDVRGLAALHRPSDDTPRIEVDDHREIGKALLRPDVGDVRHPDTIRCFDVELPVEDIVDYEPRLASVAARTPLAADLRLDPCKLRQSGHAVRADTFSLLQKIVVQFAIAVDLAAVSPGIEQHLRLALVFHHPIAQRHLKPCIEPARLDAQAPAHGPDGKLPSMLGHESVSHLASLAEYALATVLGPMADRARPFLKCPAPSTRAPARALADGPRHPYRSRLWPPSRTCAFTHRANAG